VANYTKATNFATKDALLSGNPAKIIKGTEIDDEYNAIAVAVSTKADLNSPTFTGTPLAPTAAGGTNTTQIATTAFVTAAVTGATGALGTMSTQNANNVAITGGSITGITDLAVADGGTGASSITANSVILGNGSSALNGNLVAPGTSGNILTSNGTTWASAAAPTGITATTGSAPYYGARAWVNFNGTGIVAIRASVNVSSITDHAVGRYTVNFTTAMADTNYSVLFGRAAGPSSGIINADNNTTAPTTGAIRIALNDAGNQNYQDVDGVYVGIFR